MRAIFILLLAGNLVFFGYQYFFASKHEISTAATEKGEVTSDNRELLLLSEQEGGLVTRSSSASESRLAIAGEEEKTAEFCTMIGPYSQLLQAEFAVERLVALGVPAHIAPIEIKEGQSYWVYLSPEFSEKEALRRLYELQKKNIESHIIAKGELANGISFGRYADYGDAEIRATEIKKQGYEAEIKMLPRMIQETWVVVDAGFAEKIDEKVWSDLLTKESALEKRQNFCLGVASP